MNARCQGILLPVALLLAVISCSKGSPSSYGEGTPLWCRVSSAGLDTKAGSGGVTTASLQSPGQGFGLFAWRTDQGSYFDGIQLYLDNEHFIYDDAEDVFRTVAPSYWPLGSWLSFFAYAPYHADVTAGALKYPSDDYVSGLPRLTFTPDADPSLQEDLVISAPVLDRAVSEGTVPLSFHHALTKVVFKARWMSSDPDQYDAMLENQYYVRIKSMTLSNILGENSLSYGRASYQWDALTGATLVSRATSSYTLSMENGCLAASTVPDTEVPLLDPDDPATYYAAYVTGDDYGDDFAVKPESVLYLLPQALTPGATLEVTYGLFEYSGQQCGDDIVKSVTLGELPNYIWPAGYEMTYALTLDLAGVINVDAQITFNCNAGAFVNPGELDFGSSSAGSFLGGTFMLEETTSGAFDSGEGIPYSGSSAGSFTEE